MMHKDVVHIHTHLADIVPEISILFELVIFRIPPPFVSLCPDPNLVGVSKLSYEPPLKLFSFPWPP